MTLGSRSGTDLVAAFDDIAPDYERQAGEVHAKAAARLVDLAAPRPSAHCLDVGTGTGAVARELAARLGPRGLVVGIDPSPAMLREARRLAAPRVRFLVMSAEELVFRDQTFNLVTFGDSLAYLADPFRALEEAQRVLAPRGQIALSVAQRDFNTPAQERSLQALRRLAESDGLQVPALPEYHARFGDPRVLGELLEEFGFHKVRTTLMLTGFRAGSAAEWIDLLGGLGPLAHSVVASMGGFRRAQLARELEPVMAELGEDGWRVHHAFVLAVATRRG